MKMKESESIDQFMTKVSGLVTQFQTYGESIEKKKSLFKRFFGVSPRSLLW